MESICSPPSHMLVVKHADIKIGIAEKPSKQILYLRVLPPGINRTVRIQKIQPVFNPVSLSDLSAWNPAQGSGERL